jgi:O-antigen ligase
MAHFLRNFLPTIALISALAIAPVAPEAGNVVFLAAGGAGLIMMWPAAINELRRPIVWMPLGGLALIGVAYSISAGPVGLVGLAYFAPLMAVWPLVSIARSIEQPQYPLLIGALAFCGAGAAAIMAINEVLVTGASRAGGLIANPIHFADVALLTGFVALFGMIPERSAGKFVLLLAPLLAAMAVALSGTRGAVVAFVAMLVTAMVIAVIVRLYRPRMFLLIAAGLAVAVAAVLLLGGAQISGIQRVLADVADTLANGMPTDSSTALRVQMYVGGLRAFLEAPVFGHGPLEFVAAAERLADIPLEAPPHLHSDLVDMAASAGILGIFAYLLFLLAPMVEAIRMPAGPAKAWTVVTVASLVVGFFCMGLTNAMFGILNLTTTYAAICVITGMVAGIAQRD